MFEDTQLFIGKVIDFVNVKEQQGFLMRVEKDDGTLGYYLVNPSNTPLKIGDHVEVAGQLSCTDQFHICNPTQIKRIDAPENQ